MRYAPRVPAALLALGAALVLALGIDATLASEARAQNPLRFRSVPEESSSAFRARQRTKVVKSATTASDPTNSSSGLPAAPRLPAAPTPPSSPAMPNAPDAPPAVSTSGDIVRMGSDITIEKGEVVDGDVLTFGGNIKVYGQVRGNVSATGGDVLLGSSARVDGDVLCMGGKLEEESGAFVGGQRVTGLQSKHSRDRTTRTDRVRIRRGWDGDSEDNDNHRAGTTIVRRLTYFLFWLLVAWIATRFAPRRTRGAMDSLRREPGLSFGLGFGLALLLAPSLIALALAMVILMITIIGIPVAIGLLFAYIALVILVAGWGYVVGAAALGERFSASRPGAPVSLMRFAFTGIAIIQGSMLVSEMLHHMPFLGWIGGLLWVLAMVAYSGVALLGIGSIVRSKFGQGESGKWWPLSRLFGSLTHDTPAASAFAGPVPPMPPPPPPPAPMGAPDAPFTPPPAPYDPSSAPRTSPGYSGAPSATPPASTPPPPSPGWGDPPPVSPPSSYMPPAAPPAPPAPPPAPPTPEPPPPAQ